MPSVIDALKRAFEDKKKLSIGAALMMVPIVNLIGVFFVMGYMMAYSYSIQKGKDRLPEWKDWKKMFVPGLKAFLLNLVISLPIMALAIIYALIVALLLEQGGLETAANLVFVIAGFIIIILLMLLTAYLMPAAFIRYAREGKMDKALNIRELARYCFRWSYLSVWIRAGLMSFGVTLITVVLSLITSFTVVIPYILEGYMMMIQTIIYFSMFSWFAVESKKAR